MEALREVSGGHRHRPFRWGGANRVVDAAPKNMSKFMEDAQNPEFQKVLEQAFRELGTEGGSWAGF